MPWGITQTIVLPTFLHDFLETCSELPCDSQGQHNCHDMSSDVFLSLQVIRTFSTFRLSFRSISGFHMTYDKLKMTNEKWHVKIRLPGWGGARLVVREVRRSNRLWAMDI